MPDSAKPDLDLIRAAARRFLDGEHRILLRTIVREDVARAVYLETMMRTDDDPGDVDAGLVEATIEQIMGAKPSYAWAGEGPTCGAEPDALDVQLGCKPCGLPAGHDGHRYPWPMPTTEEKREAAESAAV